MTGLRLADAFRSEDDPDIGSKVDVALRPPGADRDALLIVATPNLFFALRNL